VSNQPAYVVAELAATHAFIDLGFGFKHGIHE